MLIDFIFLMLACTGAYKLGVKRGCLLERRNFMVRRGERNAQKTRGW